MTKSNFNLIPCPKCKGVGAIPLHHLVFQCWQCQGIGQIPSAEMRKPIDWIKVSKILLFGLWDVYGETVLKVLKLILAFLWAAFGGRNDKTFDFIEARLSPSDESQLPAQDSISDKKSPSGESHIPAQEFIKDKKSPSDESQLLTGIGVRQILSPRIKAAFAVSAIFGATASTVLSYFMFEYEIFWGGYLFFIGFGAVISILTNYFFMVIVMDIAMYINKIMDERLAFLVALIGIIPGVFAAAVGTLLFWGILL